MLSMGIREVKVQWYVIRKVVQLYVIIFLYLYYCREQLDVFRVFQSCIEVLERDLVLVRVQWGLGGYCDDIYCLGQGFDRNDRSYRVCQCVWKMMSGNQMLVFIMFFRSIRILGEGKSRVVEKFEMILSLLIFQLLLFGKVRV